MTDGDAPSPGRPEGVVRLHLPRHLLDQAVPGLVGFYPRVMHELGARGLRVRAIWRDLDALVAPCAPSDFDIIHQGRIARDRALNTCVAYLDGFWYVDPKGVFGDSSIADLPFDPALVRAVRARTFFDKLVSSRVRARKSRYHQASEQRCFGPGHITVFLQTDSDPVRRVQHLDRAAMVGAVLAETGGRQVVIKPHPQDQAPATLRWLTDLAQSRADITVTDANVHDVLAGAAVSVSISSAASLEGMLHHVPAVLFGRSDLHHCAVTVRQAQDWAEAMHVAITRVWPFEAFVFWFLRQGCVPVTWAGFADTLLERMRAQGADLAALGLRPD